MVIPKVVLFLLLAAGHMVASAAAVATEAPSQLFHIATEYSPPSSMVEAGRVVGIATDKVREAMRRADLHYTLDVLPWKRAYSVALTRPNGCVYSTTRTPEREHLFKWVGPTDEGEWVFLGRAGRRFNVQSLEDARKLRIGTYNGDARDSYLRARGFRVDPAPSDMNNAKKLLLDRIDLWAVSMRRDSPMLANNGWAGRIVPVFTFNHVKLYLACNRAVPDAAISKLNAAFSAMQRDGTLRRLDSKYDNWTEGQPVAQ